MMTTRPSLRELLTSVDMWFEHEDDTVGARAKLGKTGVEYFAVAKSELAQLHPLLPRAMQESMKEHNWSDSTAINGASVRSLLTLLNASAVFCGNSAESTSIFVEVYSVDVPGGDTIWLRGRHVLLQVNDQFIGPQLPLISATQSVGEAIKCSVLDEHYPGWLERLQMAQTLDIPAEDYMSYVFVKPLSSAPSLSGLSFDGIS